MKELRTRLALALLLGGSLSAWAQPADAQADPLAGSAASLTEAPDRGSLSVRGAFYVPAYSSQAMARGGLDVNFSVTLSIHNASADKPLVVERIAYYDTAGGLVQDYLTAPLAVRPFGTIEVFVAVDDVRGAESRTSSSTGPPRG